MYASQFLFNKNIETNRHFIYFIFFDIINFSASEEFR